MTSSASRSRWRPTRRSIVPLAVGCLTSALWFSRETQSFPWGTRREVIESLQDPRAVLAIDAEGLVLGRNERLTIPGSPFSAIANAALWEATRRGVEVGADGRAVGLLPIWHWCGNDPIREHVARIPLTQLVQYRGRRAVLSLLGPRLECDRVLRVHADGRRRMRVLVGTLGWIEGHWSRPIESNRGPMRLHLCLLLLFSCRSADESPSHRRPAVRRLDSSGSTQTESPRSDWRTSPRATRPERGGTAGRLLGPLIRRPTRCELPL